MFSKKIVTHGGVGALLVAVLSACGQGTTATSDTTASGTASAMPMASAMASEMAGMESSMPTASGMGSMDSMPGMDHGTMGSTTSDAPYDAQFIDSMIEHHTGAITMAEDALKNAEHQEIKDLAQAIIRDQQTEVSQMQGWRKQWYPDLAPTGGMGMDMGDMTVGGDASQPYDQRFITAMIAHHTGAIEMARDAEQKAEHQEIKDLAQAIITAQEAEVKQLQEWQTAWYGS